MAAFRSHFLASTLFIVAKLLGQRDLRVKRI